MDAPTTVCAWTQALDTTSVPKSEHTNTWDKY